MTESDDGQLFTLALGQEASLRLDSAWLWDQPALDGAAVELTPVDYLVDPGVQEWLVTGVSGGAATLTAHGEPNCADQAACPPRAVRIAFRVQD